MSFECYIPCVKNSLETFRVEVKSGQYSENKYVVIFSAKMPVTVEPNDWERRNRLCAVPRKTVKLIHESWET